MTIGDGLAVCGFMFGMAAICWAIAWGGTRK